MVVIVDIFHVSQYFFSERTRDREVVIQFKVPNCSKEELAQGSKLYDRAMNASEVCFYYLWLLSKELKKNYFFVMKKVID